MVPHARHEAQQEVAVRRVHLDAVETGLLGALGRCEIALFERLDLFKRKAARGIAVRFGLGSSSAVNVEEHQAPPLVLIAAPFWNI